jgi:Mlc titration factor MtfA (ptsG expression regulator)
MTVPVIVITVLLTAGIAWRLFLLQKSRRLLKQPLPVPLRNYVQKEFPRILALPSRHQEKLEGLTLYLMETKNFEPCGGLKEVTDEMKALICAQAALLLTGLAHHRYYPKLQSILVYPGAFRDKGRRRFGIHEESDRGTLLGESWETGSVILSWDSVVAGARNADDGMNVTIHEFAHQLDQENGTDGVPVLKDRAAYRQWAEVFERNYEELVEDVEDGKGPEPLIDPYGATNPAEFFAVASETFFEESEDLRKEHPDLYEQLRNYYGLDPAMWPKS